MIAGFPAKRQVLRPAGPFGPFPTCSNDASKGRLELEPKSIENEGRRPRCSKLFAPFRVEHALIHALYCH